MFFIIFLAFAQLGYLLFGTQVKDFAGFDDSIFTLFRIILGDFNFHDLEQANRYLGPAYFILYVFFVFFVLLNMFLAIINDTYTEVKAEIAGQKNEFEMTDYFKQGYMKMMEKLNLKRDKIVDIQKALASADINKDQQLDFEEWRQDLKTRGYADAEIEAVFAKYDADGDRVLDSAEQRHMHADLEGQKDALSKEFDHLKGRPGTARPDSSLDNGSDLDEDNSSVSHKGAGSRMGGGVAQEEFQVLTRRVDRMEHSIGSIVSKIDAVLIKLEAMERNKSKRRETMAKILDSITEAEQMDGDKRDKMEKLVRDELERWDSESSLGRGSNRALSPLGSAVIKNVGPQGGAAGGGGGSSSHSDA
jgi:polycystin 2